MTERSGKKPKAADDGASRTSAFDEQSALAFEPFDGDFGGPGDRVLKDKICTARKAGECHECLQQIVPGTRIRSRSEVSDGEMMSFRWCELCCHAMTLSWTDGGRAIDARHQLRESAQLPELSPAASGNDPKRST